MIPLRMLAAGALAAAALASCGDDDEASGSSTTATATVARTTTTPATTTSAVAGCAASASRALQLVRDFSNESRGIVAPDLERYRARARAIVREAKRARCPLADDIEQQLGRFIG